MKKIVRWILIGLAGLVVLTAAATPFMMLGMDKIRADSLSAVDFSNTPDGEYEGTYAVTRWRYRVSVRIESGRIVSIRLLDNAMAAQDETSRRLIQAVLEKQTVEIGIDALGGASITGKAFLKSIENALQSAAR